MEAHYIAFLTDGRVFESTVDEIGRDYAVPKTTNPPFVTPGVGGGGPLQHIIGMGGVRIGFDAALQEMAVGESRTVELPPERADGRFVTITVPLTDKVPVMVVTPWNNFSLDFSETPAVNKVVRDPRWGWSMREIAIDELRENVTLQRLPEVGSSIRPYGWNATVVAVDSSADGGRGTITVRHSPRADSKVLVDGKNAGEIVSLTDSQVVIRYNVGFGPLRDKVLVFEIELIRIVK